MHVRMRICLGGGRTWCTSSTGCEDTMAAPTRGRQWAMESGSNRVKGPSLCSANQHTLQQGSLHSTPEHCLVNGGFPLFWWKKPCCFKWANVSFKEPSSRSSARTPRKMIRTRFFLRAVWGFLRWGFKRRFNESVARARGRRRQERAPEEATVHWQMPSNILTERLWLVKPAPSSRLSGRSEPGARSRAMITWLSAWFGAS